MNENLLNEIEEYCARTGTAPLSFSLASVKNRHFVANLRRGAQIRPTTVERVRQFMLANPSGVTWRPRLLKPASPEEYIAGRIREEDRGYQTPCRIWKQWVNPKGYARADVPRLGVMYIHRAAYSVHVGPIPDGFEIDHLCRVPGCCNPNHLEAVTSEENRRRQNEARAREIQLRAA